MVKENTKGVVEEMKNERIKGRTIQKLISRTILDIVKEIMDHGLGFGFAEGSKGNRRHD